MADDRSERPGDVLSQATRARLFAHLSAIVRPASTEELAAELRLHPSGVRVHLERLRAAGLIVRERTPQAVGRPRDSWSIAPDALPTGQPADAYPRLARWLARSIPAHPRRLQEVERSGRTVGHELAPRPQLLAGDAQEAMGRALTALGFAPQRQRADAGRVRYRLGSCPYREAVHDNQPVVCALHRGLTLGLLDRLAPEAQLTAFLPEDPDRAGCVIEVANLAAGG